jgi:hypothetical protein
MNLFVCLFVLFCFCLNWPGTLTLPLFASNVAWNDSHTPPLPALVEMEFHKLLLGLASTQEDLSLSSIGITGGSHHCLASLFFIQHSRWAAFRQPSLCYNLRIVRSPDRPGVCLTFYHEETDSEETKQPSTAIYAYQEPKQTGHS